MLYTQLNCVIVQLLQPLLVCSDMRVLISATIKLSSPLLCVSLGALFCIQCPFFAYSVRHCELECLFESAAYWTPSWGKSISLLSPVASLGKPRRRKSTLPSLEQTKFDMGSCFAGGKMAYGAIDAIGGKMSPKVVASIRKSGTYMLYGALDPSSVSASNSDLLANTKVLPVGCMTPGIVRLHKPLAPQSLLCSAWKVLPDWEISVSSVNTQACLLDHPKLPAIATQRTFHPSLAGIKLCK